MHRSDPSSFFIFYFPLYILSITPSPKSLETVKRTEHKMNDRKEKNQLITANLGEVKCLKENFSSLQIAVFSNW